MFAGFLFSSLSSLGGIKLISKGIQVDLASPVVDSVYCTPMEEVRTFKIGFTTDGSQLTVRKSLKPLKVVTEFIFYYSWLHRRHHLLLLHHLCNPV
jgi:hypothetical protein